MPEEKKSPTLLVEDAKLIFRNFSGMARQYNTEGDRNFSVVLEPGLAKKLLDEGWRVKQLKPREDGEEGDYHLKVTVNYKTGRPPRCVLISSKGRTDLGSEEVGMLDAIEIGRADVLINGWWSDMNGGGYGGFLKSAFVTMVEDELELKYAEMQEANAGLKADDNYNE